MARCHEERLDKSWFEGDARYTIDRAAALMSDLGVGRDDVLLVLDNAETLARSAEEEDELGRVISHLARRLCRVLVTSRRREKLEAQPIQVHPMAEEEGSRLLKRFASEYHAQALRDAGEPRLRRVTRELSGRPLLLDVVARLVGKFGYSVERGVESTLRLAAGDLGTFLYDDAWARVGSGVQEAFLVVGQLGGTVNGNVVGWACAEIGVSHQDLLSALEETRFGSLMDYGTHYDLSMDPSARAYLQQKFGHAPAVSRKRIEAAAAQVQRRHRQWTLAQTSDVSDRVARAFRTHAAKAAHRAGVEKKTDDAVRWYEEAIQADRGNAALLDRFAWYLMKECRNLGRALQVAREACEADAQDADAFFTQGMILGRLGNAGGADAALIKAHELGKAAHLCALQRALARLNPIDDLFRQEPVDLARIASLIEEGKQLLQQAKLEHTATNLDAKHESERLRAERRLQACASRASYLRSTRRKGQES